MSGKGNCHDNAAVETFFKTIKAELIWRHPWETRRKAEMAIFEYINGLQTRVEGIQHWAGKAPSLSNRRWLERALGAARKRDRSNVHFGLCSRVSMAMRHTGLYVTPSWRCNS